MGGICIFFYLVNQRRYGDSPMPHVLAMSHQESHFVFNTALSPTSKPLSFSRHSHKRLTLLVENAQTTKQSYVITPFEVNRTQYLTCKYPNDTIFVYHFDREDPNTRIGDRIRYARLMAGYTQSELADRLDIDRVTLIRLENNQVSDWNMKTDLLVTIATTCGFERTYCCDNYHAFIANDGGAQIKAYRKRHQITQQSLADLLGVNRTTVRRWEKNRDKPSPDKLMVLFPQLFENLYYYSPVKVSR